VFKVVIVRLTQQDFEAADARFQLHEKIPTVYACAAGNCIFKVRHWVAKTHNADVAHVVERGDSGQGPLVDALAREGINSVTIKAKADESGGGLHHFKRLISWPMRFN